MTELLTAAQMRTIEQAAIDSGEVTGLELMERAGRGVVEAIFEEWPELAKTSHCAVVLCGPGNNGGDGFVVARLLKEWGWEVEVFLYGDAEKLPPDAKVNCERWVEHSRVNKWDDSKIEDEIEDFIPGKPDSFKFDLVVDALFGIGINRHMPDDTERVWHAFVPTIFNYTPSNRPRYVSIDVPSGLCSDSGANFGAFPCDLTVTFHRAKLGHFQTHDGHYGGGPALTGKLVVKPIGINSLHHISLNTKDSAFDTTHICKLASCYDRMLIKGNCNHKFSHGHALIASGPATKTGAARLAARAALRIGAGLVTIASPTSALAENAAHLTAIMLRAAETLEQFEKLLSDDRITSVCLGPGFVRESESGGLNFNHTRQMVEIVLKARKKTVLDADALTAFQDDPTQLFAILHPDTVLTPHGGEFKRLFPDIHATLTATPTKGPAYSKVDATRDAAARAGCIVLFKGPDTVIADPQGRAAINSAHYDRAAPWLATAGSGDVLAGFISGLLARGFDPMRAAESAAWLHVQCALKFGPGLIAEDIPEQLPAVFRDLGL
jgi:hydroxyethylthiazole kinase-like uncharacterized protein yjeF